MNGHFYFEIQADNLERAANFYREVFGWKFEKLPGNLPLEYWRIETGGLLGGLLQRPQNLAPLECGSNAFVCSIEVDDFEKFQEKILKMGGQVTRRKFAIPGVCWQGYFIDTEKNNFGIFQVDPNAK